MTTTTVNRKQGSILDRLVKPFGIVAAGMFTAFAGFQIALMLGAPWGEHVWGSAFSAQLPPAMRVASGAAALILIGMATIVLARAGVVRQLSDMRFLTGSTWAVAGYMAFNTLGNLASESTIESNVFGPATFVMAVLTAYVAFFGPRAVGGAQNGS